MVKRFAIILAAGKGTRMKSKLHKMLHSVVGRPMIQHVIEQLQSIQLDEMATVVGYGAEEVTQRIGHESKYVTQEEQLGTGHAVLQAETLLGNVDGTTIVVCGDTPLITKETYQALIDHHEKVGSKGTVLTAKAPNPTGYGRVIRNDKNQVERIVEHKDATEQERLVDEINTGTYCFDNQALFWALKEVSNDNAQGEYYLTDVIEILKNKSENVSAFMTPEFEETMGINDRVDLSEAEKVMRRRSNEHHMNNVVTIIDPDQTYIHADVTIAQDVIIYPGSIITGQTTIGPEVEIGPHTEIDQCTIERATKIRQSVVQGSHIGEEADIGPYAYIRPETKTDRNVKIGSFVEVKKTSVDENSKIPHLSYIGDTEIGKNVNVGCGTITVNYDGKEKHKSNVADHAFIGCNSNLIAPVSIGEGAYVAAGSTITKDVPGESLSIGRARQVNKEGYATKFKKQ